MNILITGGAGFIGSNFILQLDKKYPQYTIVNYDKLTYSGFKKHLKDVNKKSNYFFIQGDILDKKLLKKSIQKYKITAIINFAAETHVDRSISNAEIFVKTNVLGTQTLLQIARETKIRKFHHISTDEVYGQLEKTGSFSELDPVNPRNPYSASKAGADMMVMAYFHTYSLPVIITRSSNNYGPRQYPEKIIPYFIKKILENKNIPIYGKGENIRDWIYVDDNCEAIDLVFHKGKIGKIYNIGGKHEITNLLLAKKLLKIIGKSEKLITFVPDRPGHDFRYSLDTTKMEKELKWKAKTDLNEGLKKTIDWYKNSLHKK
ncbi:dTDP-glucose 4,6-dehydratase [Candidatus Peregrinibacteria bacterium]|nr:dTDP-glucose 4,6-dehydratase [Candidatus Peregrinibacteria bacterium]